MMKPHGSNGSTSIGLFAMAVRAAACSAASTKKDEGWAFVRRGHSMWRKEKSSIAEDFRACTTLSR
jgi:hypothetical protein